MTIYNSADEVPEAIKHDLTQGVVLAGQKLRQWRAFGGFHELRASWLAADGELVFICHHDDRISVIDGGEATDITPLIDRDAAD